MMIFNPIKLVYNQSTPHLMKEETIKANCILKRKFFCFLQNDILFV